MNRKIQEVTKLTTHRIIKPFWERRWLIFATTLTVTVGTFCWFQQLPYAYESSVVLTATAKNGQTIQPGQVSRLYRELKTAAVFHQVSNSDPFKEHREFGETTEALAERLSNNTRILEERQGSSVVVHLSYLDLTPEAAEKGANVLGQGIALAELKENQKPVLHSELCSRPVLQLVPSNRGGSC